MAPPRATRRRWPPAAASPSDVVTGSGQGSALTLVTCGAPLAARARDVQQALIAAGWQVSLLVSEAATSWAEDSDDDRPRAEVVVACPLTFNTANKIVAGIMDTPAAGVLCDAIGARLPIVAVPMVNTRLWTHPTWTTTLANLAAWGVCLVDPGDGSVDTARPVASGTGDAVAAAFDPQWIVTAVEAVRSCG